MTLAVFQGCDSSLQKVTFFISLLNRKADNYLSTTKSKISNSAENYLSQMLSTETRLSLHYHKTQPDNGVKLLHNELW